jgi:uncharacterized protein
VEIEKTLTAPATPEAIWALLLDPQVMGGCVPGMKSIDVISPTEYVAVMHVKVSFISAKFKLKTRIVEQRPPLYLRSEGTGEDSSVASSLKQQSEIFLTPLQDGQTELKMKVKVDVLGRLGTFGLSAMKTKADRLWDEFCQNLLARIAQGADPGAGTAPAAAVTATPAASSPVVADVPIARAESMPAAATVAPATTASAPPSGAEPPTLWSRLCRALLPRQQRSIHVSIQRGDATIRIDWPIEAATECTAWLKQAVRG